jgi:hypothetical protein
MRDRLVDIVLAALAAAGMLLGQAKAEDLPANNTPAQTSTAAATNLPPAKLDKPLLLSASAEPLLLLEDEPATNAPAGGADNSRCQVCHLNFMTERLTVSHARTNIGCASCHGPSDAHIADESWASGGNGTPPDILFTRYQIYHACLACHKGEQVFAKVEKHRPFWWSIASQERVCTDCHGQHRMVKRRCKWK